MRRSLMDRYKPHRLLAKLKKRAQQYAAGNTVDAIADRINQVRQVIHQQGDAAPRVETNVYDVVLCPVCRR